jgi:serine/threonine protein kinase/serine/threonine protein phosphatase PrpC
MPRCPNPRCQADYPPGTIQCTNPFCQCLLPEAVVGGRYRIETLIGMGGMGAVYRASDTFDVKQVALKVLSLVNNLMDKATAVERFRREARYAHQLRHRNIVPVVNFGQDGDLLYVEMPLVTGGTLKALLKAEHPLPTQQALGYVKDLAAAIDVVHAHPQQIVHRDIKPSNLLIHQDDGRLVLADFGIARAMQEKALTQRGWAIGTEHYIAPEQEQGKAEPASDIYAMGVVTYQMFTGLLPFQAVIRSRASELPGPSTLNPVLPPTVDPVIMRAMEINPLKRYETATAFAESLEKALKAEDIFSAPTLTSFSPQFATSTANVIKRTLVPENPCGRCGQENRSTSRFCRRCGYGLNETSLVITDICQVGNLSERGRFAVDNEDMLMIIQGLCISLALPPHPFALFAVADGLGGPQGKTAGGHEASRLAVETVEDSLVPLLAGSTYTSSVNATRPSTPVEGGYQPPGTQIRATQKPDSVLAQWTLDAVQQANRVIYHCNADYDTSMASTLTVALLYKLRLYIACVGDSRIYHYRPGQKICCLTARNSGQVVPIQPDEVYNEGQRDPQRRYLGDTYQVPIDLSQHDVKPNDLLLLCTDGLWCLLSDEQIEEVLKQYNDPQEAASNLIEKANSAGGIGNASAIVVRVY